MDQHRNVARAEAADFDAAMEAFDKVIRSEDGIQDVLVDAGDVCARGGCGNTADRLVELTVVGIDLDGVPLCGGCAEDLTAAVDPIDTSEPRSDEPAATGIPASPPPARSSDTGADTSEPKTDDWKAESRRYDLLVVAANLLQRWRDMPSDLFEQDQTRNSRLRKDRDQWLANYDDHMRASTGADAPQPLTDRQRLNDEYMRGYSAASRMCDGLLKLERKAAYAEAAASRPAALDVDLLASQLVAADFEGYLRLAEHMSAREVAAFLVARLASEAKP